MYKITKYILFAFICGTLFSTVGAAVTAVTAVTPVTNVTVAASPKIVFQKQKKRRSGGLSMRSVKVRSHTRKGKRVKAYTRVIKTY